MMLGRGVVVGGGGGGGGNFEQGLSSDLREGGNWDIFWPDGKDLIL